MVAGAVEESGAAPCLHTQGTAGGATPPAPIMPLLGCQGPEGHTLTGGGGVRAPTAAPRRSGTLQGKGPGNASGDVHPREAGSRVWPGSAVRRRAWRRATAGLTAVESESNKLHDDAGMCMLPWVEARAGGGGANRQAGFLSVIAGGRPLTMTGK
jgi:hypothetical protein